MDDAAFCALVAELDTRVAAVDGHGFAATPFARSGPLSDELGFSPAGGVWVKDETGNVSGSHKARHLFGVLVYLEVLEGIGLADPAHRPDLAIASCGNAALAAAVVAAAGGRRLRVFVPVDAEPPVLERLEALGALVTVCPRPAGTTGDPTVHRLLEALADGALPVHVPGQPERPRRRGRRDAGVGDRLHRRPRRPPRRPGRRRRARQRVHPRAFARPTPSVRPSCRASTPSRPRSAWPLKRAYDAVVAHGGVSALAYAARHRAEFMRPWEQEPHSVAHGILDDETYDWLAVVEGMLETRGTPFVVGEPLLQFANALARETTGIAVDPTGSAGLAGLIALRDAGAARDDEHVAVLFTGVDRSRPYDTGGNRDAELHRTRHPVAQGLRAV